MALHTSFDDETIKNILVKARSFLNTGHNEQAIACYEIALARGYFDGDTYYFIALAKSRLGLHGDAIKSIKKSLKQKKTGMAYNLLGRCHLLMGHFDQAKSAYTRTIKKDSENVEAISGLANVSAQQGHYENAYRLIEPYIINRVADISLAHTASIICEKTDNLDVLLDYLLAIEKSENISEAFVKSQLLYLIANSYDKKQLYQKAMFYYHQANNSKPDVYSPLSYDQVADSIKAAYSPSFFMRGVKSTQSSDKPVFIVGMPRSGTTLVEQILSSHSRVYGAGELPFIGKKSVEIATSAGVMFPQCTSTLSTIELNNIAEQYLNLINNISRNSDYVIDKMPHNFVNLGFIYQLFPNCKIIYCQRNAIDTCLSIYFTSFNDSHPYSTRFNNLVHQYKYCNDLMKYWKKLLPIPILDISYEDIVTNFQSNLEKLVSFCEIEIEQNCLDFYKNSRFVNTASKEQVNKPVYTSSIKRWKNYLPEVQPLVDEVRSAGLMDEL